jgi:Ala-tRNA(Pro) deacylase
MAAAAQASPQQQPQSAELEETGAPAPPPHTRESTLALLRACGVPFELREHPPVMTAEAMRAALQADGGGEQGSQALVVKSLLLRDKKKRLYLLSTVEGTRVDLKALAARLGASGGLSFAPEHLLMPALGVGPGCATPLAVCNARAAGVPLLVDARLREPGVRFWAHPCGCNDASVLLDVHGLEACLHHCGRSVAAYIAIITACSRPRARRRMLIKF